MSGVTATRDRTCVVLQPGYLPLLGYFEQFGRVDVFVHLDDDAGIEVSFQDYQHPTYPQRYAGFASHLSVIDLMFHREPDSLAVIKPEPQAEPVLMISGACKDARVR